MKKISFRKIFPYDPTIDGSYSQYEGYCLITRQIVDPPIQSGGDLTVNIKTKIYTSSLLRGIQTAELISKNSKIRKYEILPELKEVKFDLSRLVSLEEYRKEGSSLVRKKFLENFVSDSLIEKREEIKRRIDNIMTIVNESDDEEILLISHSFFMKIFEAYLDNENLFEYPTLLERRLNYREKTYPNGCGFDFYL